MEPISNSWAGGAPGESAGQSSLGEASQSEEDFGYPAEGWFTPQDRPD